MRTTPLTIHQVHVALNCVMDGQEAPPPAVGDGPITPAECFNLLREFSALEEGEVANYSMLTTFAAFLYVELFSTLPHFAAFFCVMIAHGSNCFPPEPTSPHCAPLCASHHGGVPLATTRPDCFHTVCRVCFVQVPTAAACHRVAAHLGCGTRAVHAQPVQAVVHPHAHRFGAGLHAAVRSAG